MIRDFLSETCDGTVICDFNGGYDRLKCPKQRRLMHRLQEMRDLTAKDAAFRRRSAF